MGCEFDDTLCVHIHVGKRGHLDDRRDWGGALRPTVVTHVQ